MFIISSLIDPKTLRKNVFFWEQEGPLDQENTSSPMRARDAEEVAGGGQ